VAELLHVDDGLWAVLEPLLPGREPWRTGRPSGDDRIAFTAIVFVLVTAVPWRCWLVSLAARASSRGGGCATGRRPASGIGCIASSSGGSTLAGRLDWSTGVVDGSHIRALRGCPLTGRSPVDRARAGSKHHLIVDCHGVPLAATLTGGYRNDVTQRLPLVDGIGAIAGKRGRPRRLALAERDDDQRREQADARMWIAVGGGDRAQAILDQAHGVVTHRERGAEAEQQCPDVVGVRLQDTIRISWLVLFRRRPPPSVTVTMSSIRTPKRSGR
jgi:transposase